MTDLDEELAAEDEAAEEAALEAAAAREAAAADEAAVDEAAAAAAEALLAERRRRSCATGATGRDTFRSSATLRRWPMELLSMR